MRHSITLCTFVLLTFSVVQTHPHRQIRGKQNADAIAENDHLRVKRVGIRVTKLLIQLLGGNKYTFQTRKFKETLKPGTFQNAKDDFEKLNPTVFANKQGGKRVGIVGNNVVTLSHKGTTMGSYSGVKAELRIYKAISEDRVDIQSTKYYVK